MSNSRPDPARVSPVEQRVAALEALLTERGLGDPGFDDRRGPALSTPPGLPGLDPPRRNGDLACGLLPGRRLAPRG